MADCIFCDIVNHRAEATLLWQDHLVTAFLDIQPVNAGHMDIVPNNHAANLAELPGDTAAHLFRIALRLAGALRVSGLPCKGVNMFLADGEAAGQEISHVHLHVFPRVSGDGFGLHFGEEYYTKPSRAALTDVGRMIRTALDGSW
ncbi:HIT family protein [bacterium]|nr:HIT family protein [candidate division CSSED10-310 bacterium]